MDGKRTYRHTDKAIQFQTSLQKPVAFAGLKVTLLKLQVGIISLLTAGSHVFVVSSELVPPVRMRK